MSVFHRILQAVRIGKLRRMGVLNKGSSVNGKNRNTRRFFERSSLISGFLFITLFGVLLFSFTGHPENLEIPEIPEGVNSYVSVYAGRSLRIEDAVQTEAKRKQARASVPFYYRIYLSNREKLLAAYDTFLKTEIGEKESRISVLSRKENNVLNVPFRNTAASDHVRKRLEQYAERGYISGVSTFPGPDTPVCIVDEIGRCRGNGFLTRGNIVTVEAAALAISEETAELFLQDGDSHEFKQKLEPVLRKLMVPFVMKPDAEYTKNMRTLKERQTPVAMRDIRKGECLLDIGERITKEKKILLDACRAVLTREKLEHSSLSEILRGIVFSALLMLFFVLYLYLMHPDIRASNRKLAVLILILSVAILMNMSAVFFFVRFQELLAFQSWLLFMALPLGYAPLSITPMLGKQAGIFAGIFTAAAASAAAGSSYNVMVLGLFLSVWIPYAVYKSSHYREFLITGFIVIAIVSLSCGCILGLSEGIRFSAFDRWIFLTPFMVALGTTVATQVTLYLMDYLFDVVTDMSLHLLIAGDHPLLRQLQLEAPGTYHHSLMVSLLAENACRIIGANALQARIGALFHDVGKLRHPEYFTENGSPEDKYRELSPRSSALFIINHVKTGLELASEYHLKRVIRDIIEQHHGTDVVFYFYKKAKDSGVPFDENDFHYKGPKPKTREAAVVSLADACEAAARSLEKPTHSRISELVQSIFMNRLKNGQLDKSELTFRDVTLVRECFIKTLTSMHHARIAYPKQEEGNEKESIS